jgi:hypothetical protein
MNRWAIFIRPLRRTESTFFRRAGFTFEEMMKLTTTLFANIILLALGSTLAHAQGPPSPPSRNARPDAVQRELQRQFEMQAIERALNDGHSRPVQRYSPLVLEQIRTDFLRIQVVDRELARAISASDILDLKLVAGAATEIRKRAGRLKENLALPKPESVVVKRSAVTIEP